LAAALAWVMVKEACVRARVAFHLAVVVSEAKFAVSWW
jgi:hypothetical protein